MRERDNSVSFAMLPSALLVSLLFGDSVHTMRSIFSDYQEGAAIFGSVSPACGGRTKFAPCAVALSRSEAIGGTEALRLALGPLRRDHHLLFSFSFAASASLVPLGCLASAAVGVAQWFVDFCADPQTV
jgi:hypothetical protein